jgi:GLPGLI family protein
MKTAIIGVILLTIPILSKSQFNEKYTTLDTVKYIITYSLSFQEDTLSPNFIIQEDMLLLVGKRFSKFVSYNHFVGDSMFRNVQTHEEFQRLVADPINPLPRVKILYQVFKNHTENKISTYDYIFGNAFRYDEDINLFNWRLGSDSDVINGFNLQNAKCSFGGRNWEAWFSTEIPIIDGPYKFTGLPGLIFKAADEENHYVFEFISIQHPAYDMVIDLKDKTYIQSDKKDFIKARQNFRRDIISRARDAGLSNEAQQTAARNMEHRNNPIELE